MSSKLAYSPKRTSTVPTEQAARETEICVDIIRNLYQLLDEQRAATAAAAAVAQKAKNRLRRSQRKVAVLRRELNKEGERTDAAYDEYRDLYYRHDRVMEDQDFLTTRCEEREREIANLRDQLHCVRHVGVATEFWGGEGEAFATAAPPSPIPQISNEDSVLFYANRGLVEVDDFPGIADAFYGR